ncbi:competence protein CoiA [Alkalihalobacillus sp. AL-G]|uniref:competence protein CoiA n=1 Tax=Alkalihalobacillus sp. AL-G TaxID=2926399 RepID=UPI00272A8866|nr:competence protein CoiA family protein [Alkalihalobacillus sp. AL-G]WLD94922.1 hypothetical protein MOJ78_08585 [Alkalihalobacillus sp. AL-G]
MLLAKSASGQLINLGEPWERKDLEQLRKNESFLCPACSNTVQLKLGSKRIWHFSHLDSNECSGQHEPESMYHLTAKVQLYQWLKKNYPIVKMEHYFTSFKQRPDLLLSNITRLYAIEFQCSTISEKLIQKRTATYSQHSIEPYWILGHSRISAKSDCVFRMDDVAWNAIRFAPKTDPFLIYYSPRNQYFFLLQSIIPFSTRTVFATPLAIALPDATFPVQIDPKISRFPTSLIQPWKNLLQQTRLYLHLSRDPAVLNLKKRMLDKGIPVSLFPAEAGIPTKYLYWFKTPSYIWQTRFLIEMIDPLPLGSSIDFQNVYRLFIKQFSALKIKRRLFSIKVDSHISFAIMDYMNWLTRLGVLERKSSVTFIKMRGIEYPSSIAEANQRVLDILQKLST